MRRAYAAPVAPNQRQLERGEEEGRRRNKTESCLDGSGREEERPEGNKRGLDKRGKGKAKPWSDTQDGPMAIHSPKLAMLVHEFGWKQPSVTKRWGGRRRWSSRVSSFERLTWRAQWGERQLTTWPVQNDKVRKKVKKRKPFFKVQNGTSSTRPT